MGSELENMEILRLSNEESNRITRECLRIAMFKLMGREPFEKITITELAKCAGVSRVAFYRNYETKEELVEDLCRSLFVELKASLESERFRTDRRTWYVDFFRTIRDNSEYFRIYLDANLRLTEEAVLETVFPSATSGEQYANVAREGAFLAVLTAWFRAGIAETPEEMADICMDVLVR